jgi:hypothetical protein
LKIFLMTEVLQGLVGAGWPVLLLKLGPRCLGGWRQTTVSGS